MELKDVKTLQEMGFSLEEIKAVYYSDTPAETSAKTPEATTENSSSGTGSDAEIIEKPEHFSEGSKKNDSSDYYKSLEKKIEELKNMMFKANAREPLAETPKTETVSDILSQIIGGKTNG